MNRKIAIAAAVAILSMSPNARAQSATDEVLTVTGYELMTPSNMPALTRAWEGDGLLVRAPQSTQFAAPLHLPDGAYITAISLESCNATPYTNIDVTVTVRCFPPNQACDFVSGGVGTLEPGVCATKTGGFVTPVGPVDNRTKTYWITGGFGPYPDDAISTIRVYYQRTITPTYAFPQFFDDVPDTHPFYQFVQALAAANITAGCDYRTFCPNAFVTRGQLAVLLSKALGLYTFP